MVYPPIHWFQGIRGRKRVGDIEFLCKKEFGGKLRTGEGTLSATGDLVKITANSGKDMYLAKAKVSARTEDATSGPLTVIVELQAGANGSETTKATWACEVSGMATGAQTAGSGSSTATYEFAVSGIKVAATEVIQLEATTVDVDVEVSGEIVVFEETTGADPTI